MSEKVQSAGKLTLSPKPSADSPLPPALMAVLHDLYVESQASRWLLSFAEFCVVFERSARKCGPAASAETLESYLRALHLKDLALASGCATGCEAAWEYFVATYRGYLRAAAGAILHCSADSPAARDLADSLFGDLYGLREGKQAENSLFRYFHGRSSLKTWLRAVLSQRHVDQVRAAKRLVDLEDQEAGRALEQPGLPAVIGPLDPHRERYIQMFRRALGAALGSLDPSDRERLRCYYAEEQTLAAIGKKLGEHESSVSRSLERIRRGLRQKVEDVLRAGLSVANGSRAAAGLSDAEIALCFRYAAEDPPIDLDRLLAAPGSAREREVAVRRKKASGRPGEGLE